ncbi:MAG: porin family protein [Prevotella sp.]|nr:porin family protein [Prevotella sp.]
MKRLLLFLMCATMALGLWAQADEEYKMEVGGGVGLVSYEGDFNGNITKGAQPLASLVLKRVLNPYMDVTAQLSYGKLKGSSNGLQTFYPDYSQEPYSFSNSLIDLGIRYEYNFWPYGTGREYLGARRLTPFVFGGLGGTYVDAGKSVLVVNVPIGAGVKYKVAPRLNLSLEWAMHFTDSDKLDGVEDPYHITSSGVFKNRDCYSVLQLTLTYSFLPKCRVCHNADE